MKTQITSDFEALIDENNPNYKKRYLVYWGGRGSGKSVSVAKALLIRGMKNKEFILCTREYQNSISDSVIKTLSDEIANMGIESFYEVQANRIIGKNGTEFIFKGIKNNVNSIKSIPNISLVWIEEAQTVSHNSYEVLIPTIRKDGSQIIVTFNPINPTDPSYERFVKTQSDDIHCVNVNYDKNPWLPDTLKKEIELMRQSDPEGFEHVYLGKFDTRRSGAVYAKLLDKARVEARITRVPYDPSCEVFTAWDLGWSDSTAIWWAQIFGREVRVIDYYENTGEDLGHYAGVIKSKPYNYARLGHYLPHDANAGNIRGDTPSAQLTRLGVPNTVLQTSSVEGGIEAVRQLLPICVFDQDATKDGLFALENYAYEWDEERKIFKNKPKHDWSSNGADAMRYLAHAIGRIKGGLSNSKPVSFQIKTTGSYMGR